MLAAGAFQKDLLTTAREPDELIVSVRFPVMSGRGVAFQEVARRHGDFAIIAVAALVEGKSAVRLGVGGMSGRPAVRQIAAADGSAAGAAIDKMASELEGYEDLHASAAMRRDLLRRLAPVVIDEAYHAPIDKDQRAKIRLTLNGRALSAKPSRACCSDFLRHSLGATGTHVGCEHGVCGCCTVLIDGAAVRSCLTLAVQAEGARRAYR